MLYRVSCGNEGVLPRCPPAPAAVLRGEGGSPGPLPPDRDAVVGALMPASMIAPECPSFSSAPPSEASATASPVSGEACLLAADPEDRLSPSPWQEKRGEVSE